jgi:hypothetical protein
MWLIPVVKTGSFGVLVLLPVVVLYVNELIINKLYIKPMPNTRILDLPDVKDVDERR